MNNFTEEAGAQLLLLPRIFLYNGWYNIQNNAILSVAAWLYMGHSRSILDTFSTTATSTEKSPNLPTVLILSF